MMEFTMNVSSFATALEQIQSAVDKKNTIPILTHCMVEAEPQGLLLSATDLELGIRLPCPTQVKEAGSVAVPARRLLDIAQSLGEGEVRVQETENHWVRITSGRSAFKLVAMAKDNFPSMPVVPQPLGSVSAVTLGGMIDRTAFAISQQEGRYTLNAALMVLKHDSILMVATDGSRLPLVGQDAEVSGLKNEERLLIPRRALAALGRLAGTQEGDTPVQIAKDDSHLFFTVGDAVLISRMISGQFPNYEAALPQSNGITATVDTAAFRKALERVSLLASDQHHGVSLALDAGRITLSSAAGDTGEAMESLDAEYSQEPIRLGFNSQFLLDFFKVVRNGNVVMTLKDVQSAAEFRPADPQAYRYRYVVMPMRM